MWLKEIKLQAGNPAILKHFYGQILSLRVESFSDSIAVHTQESLLIFDKADKTEKPFYHFAFNIPFNKIDEAFTWLKERVELLWLDDYKGYIAEFVNWNARSLYFYDPAGNIVELIGRADLNDNADELFSSKHFRNISEIGIVLPRVYFDEEIKQLMDHHQLHYFDKQKPLEQFRAIGDDRGLFICVPDGRSWYPVNDKPSAVFPMKIKFEEDGNNFSLKL